MGNLHQFSFEFTFCGRPRNRQGRNPLPWRIRRLVASYGLSEAQARVYATLIGLPVDRHE